MKAMELLVPSDHLEILRLNKQALLPFRKDHHRSLVCDYLGLLNTRIDDLERFSREDAGGPESGTTGLASCSGSSFSSAQ